MINKMDKKLKTLYYFVLEHKEVVNAVSNDGNAMLWSACHALGCYDFDAFDLLKDTQSFAKKHMVYGAEKKSK